MTEGKNELEGIGGWLILVAIGVVFTPIRIAKFLLETYPPIFREGAWDALTTPGNDAYHPLLATIIGAEMVLNLLLLAASGILLALFFSRKAAFPKWYIGIAVFSLVFIALDAMAIKLVLPDEPMFDPETASELIRSLVTVVIWVPYMLVSKRVKATFTR
ncbi:MAG TPA: DUF2569 domain-containing protein [Gammaproteobacteria bacterium]|nr:DUF2569 domain-containing protein [Gammaproteobacteria bacterium]